MSKSQIIENARQSGRNLLTEIESKQVLKQAGVNTNDIRLAASEDEAVSLSRQIGFPVVLKVSSLEITHKSDAGGVKVGIKNESEVSRAYREIMTSVKQKCPTAKIDGITVQNMINPGVEIIIGMTRDAQFGPVLMFGLGGIWVELLKDVSFRIVPLTRWDARSMIQEIRGYSILKGYRNTPPVNLDLLEDTLLNVSSFIEKTPEIQEMDINPAIAGPNEITAADARIILSEKIAG